MPLDRDTMAIIERDLKFSMDQGRALERQSIYTWLLLQRSRAWCDADRSFIDVLCDEIVRGEHLR